jgi:hypothetical protein
VCGSGTARGADVRFIDPLLGRTKDGRPARVLEAVWIPEWERWASIDTSGMSASLWRDGDFRQKFIPEMELAIQPPLFCAECRREWR